jgi:long-chain acyl-CoA synthetase
MSRVLDLIDSIDRQGAAACLHDGVREWTYAELSTSIKHFRTWVRENALSEVGTIGLRADFGLEPIALLLALLAEQRVVALMPRDRNAEDYAADACVTDLLAFDGERGLVRQHLAAGRSHALLDGLKARGESGVVIFTSGSSGKPKAALQGTERLLQKFARPGRKFRTLAFLMFDHIAGLDTLFHTLTAGGTIVTLSRRTPAAVLEVMEAARVEVLPTSPSFLRLLCASDALGSRDLSALKIITYGSEPMDQTTLRVIGERFPQCQIIQKYGTTETGSPRTESRGNDSLWLRFKQSNAEGALAHTVRDGVLWLKGPGTFLGYLNVDSPVAADGWYCTGDLVEQDGEWVRFKGRVSEVINVGGEKVAPLEVEATILELPYVTSAVVRGEPHVLLGQIVTAKVAVSESEQATVETQLAAAIRKHCRARLAGYKVPMKIAFVTGGLLTDRQKANRTLSWVAVLALLWEAPLELFQRLV